ncbi:MAG: IPTL-CTERM sorting domain-containing protein [Terriglobales bacterium]
MMNWRTRQMGRAPIFVAIVAAFLWPCARAAGAQTWNLVQQFTFNGAAGSAPPSSQWTYDEGNNHGWGNQEQEYYCAPSDDTPPCSTAQPNIYEDGNGDLVIQARHTSSGTWTSGRMRTQGLYSVQYGRIEARMQLPVGAGLWPAFWMLGSDIDKVPWPGCGELDIMENVPALGPTEIQSSVHDLDDNNMLHGIFTFPSGETVSSGFHVYGMIWSPYLIQFYVDDPSNVFATITPATPSSNWPFNQSTTAPNPFFLLLNLAVGGDWPGPPSASTPDPATMLVNYVRVYQAAAIPGPTISGSGFSVTAGAAGSTVLNMTGQSGTTGKVYLACSAAPADSTCTIAPNVVDFTNANSATATLNLSTTANSGLFAPAPGPDVWPWSLGLAAFLLAGFGWARKRRRWAAGFGAAALALVLAGCGGGASPGAPTSPSTPSGGTPAGNYTLTVTAYTVSGASSSGSISLTVN